MTKEELRVYHREWKRRWRLANPRVPKPQARSERHWNWRGEEAGYKAIHEWLRRNFTKTGVCEECGIEAMTQWSFLKHPEKHTRERSDYRELCPKCHAWMDSRGRIGWRSMLTHCKRGHEFTLENTKITSKGSRSCRECLRITSRNRYHEKRVAA